MRIVSITRDYFEKYAKGDREFMLKHGRPCLIVLRLSFRGRKLDFAVDIDRILSLMDGEKHHL